MKYLRSVVVLVAALALSACFPGVDSIVLTVQTNGTALSDVEVTVNGTSVGTTDENGQVTLTNPEGDSIDVVLSRQFFSQPSLVTILLDGSVVEATLELDPIVYVPDHQAAGTPRVVAMNAIDAATADYTEITSVVHGSGTHVLNGPTDVVVDYDNGALYILDTAGDFSASYILKLTAFPPASDGSEATLYPLFTDSSGLTTLDGAQQMALAANGEVLVTAFDDFSIVKFPSDFLTSGIERFFVDGGVWNPTGIAVSSSGQILYSAPGLFSDPHVRTRPSFTGTETDFASLTGGSGANQTEINTRVQIAVDGFVYVSDTGEGGTTNSRIIRFNADGTGFTSYGSTGSGVGQFQYPLLLGILPDRRLYIMDDGNNRVVRIDPEAFDDPTQANWAETVTGAGFDFDYWYSSC